MKNPSIYHVAPDKHLEEWAILKEGRKEPRVKGLSKKAAIKKAARLAEKGARPAMVLVHKTRYIIERQLQFST